jgi:hypothetical protein
LLLQEHGFKDKSGPTEYALLERAPVVVLLAALEAFPEVTAEISLHPVLARMHPHIAMHQNHIVDLRH